MHMKVNQSAVVLTRLWWCLSLVMAVVVVAVPPDSRADSVRYCELTAAAAAPLRPCRQREGLS